MIRVENLSKSYREGAGELTVIGGLSCEFPSGQSVAIIGRSGVGKSTLLHLLGGLDRPTTGSVHYGEIDIARLDPDGLSAFRGSNIGFIFQFHHLLPEFDAVENVSMPLIIAGQDEARAQELSRAVLCSVGLEARLHHRPSELSGGEQQRVAIGRALVGSPKVILADEPTGNLDHATAAIVQNLLLSLCRERGATLIVVTHNLELARNLDISYEMLPEGKLQGLTFE